MFARHRDYYRAAALERFEWLDHGFGTRHSVWIPEDSHVSLRQVHSGIVLLGERPGCLGVGDGLVTARAGLPLVVRTADCLPVLIADPERRAVAAIHAGWRGVLHNIAGAAVARLAAEFASQPASLHAAIGPGIGACCFEVGPEVAALFKPLLPERTDLNISTRLDLVEILRRQLDAAGIPAANIAAGAPCTFCAGDEFHSWRRDRPDAGRMQSFIVIRDW